MEYEQLPKDLSPGLVSLSLAQPSPDAAFGQASVQQLEALPTLDLQGQILQHQLQYLEQQRAEAIANGDSTQQLAAEHIIRSKVQRMNEGSLGPSQIRTTDDPIVDREALLPARDASTTKKKSSRIDNKVRALLKTNVESLQDRIHSNRTVLSDLQTHIDELRVRSVQLPTADIRNDSPDHQSVHLHTELQSLEANRDREDALAQQARHTLEDLRQLGRIRR